MKKFTLFAAFAALAMSASAQYSVSPEAQASVVEGSTQVFDLVVAADEVLTSLEAAGQKVNDWRVNDVDRFLYVWENTFTGGDGSYPAPGYTGMVFDYGYPSLNVGSVGWSGAGWFVSAEAGCSTAAWCDDTKVHVAYRTEALPPSSVAIIIGDGDPAGSSPAKVALGTSFVDGASTYPTIGAAFTDEWQAIDISFADLKKFYPTFNYVNVENWQGNVVSVLGGGVTGQNICFDNIYFHSPASEGGVGSVEGDAQFVITSNTVNVANGQGIELYDLSGRLVKSSNGTVLGIDDLRNGVFVVKSGNSVTKIMK